MRTFLIFTDRFGRRWVCGRALRILFGIKELGAPKFWNYDLLCRRRFHE